MVNYSSPPKCKYRWLCILIICFSPIFSLLFNHQRREKKCNWKSIFVYIWIWRLSFSKKIWIMASLKYNWSCGFLNTIGSVRIPCSEAWYWLLLSCICRFYLCLSPETRSCLFWTTAAVEEEVGWEAGIEEKGILIIHLPPNYFFIYFGPQIIDPLGLTARNLSKDLIEPYFIVWETF